MNSAGDVEEYLTIVRTRMERRGCTLDEAMDAGPVSIPAELRPAIRLALAAPGEDIVEITRGSVLANHDRPPSWPADHDSSTGYYWTRQRRFLSEGLHRSHAEIANIDTASDQVLHQIGYPNTPAGFHVKGLVVGYVQSGKTANFSALIAKAADSGYRIVIVLSGLHNSLRKQTQERLERDLGRAGVDGVGNPEPGRRWVWMTTADPHGDFDPGTAGEEVLQGTNQVIFVVKKNTTRLHRLAEWMKDRVPASVPVLVIDDEADQASVNTGGNRPQRGETHTQDTDLEETDLIAEEDYDRGANLEEELDPSTINRNIRQLLALFANCSYVAYTATPFANILIDPNAIDREAGEDLFPSDFIISLPKPSDTAYVGTERLFGRDAILGVSDPVPGLDVIVTVPPDDVAQLIPTSGRDTSFSPTMPRSLRDAIHDFVLASAARLDRAQHDVACTMLVHTSALRALQNRLAPLITTELDTMRREWLYGGPDLRERLRRRWQERFEPITADMDIRLCRDFDELLPHIAQLIDHGIEVRVLNSDHPDELDFIREPTLKAVLIGGNKLSRGVTVEGLLVSYYVRETLYYDTLMQMGRWFGYKGDHVDLTRLYSTDLIIGCFHDLATAEEELRREIDRYAREHKTPRDFVPKVRLHPIMSITAPNKMQAAQNVQTDFSNRLIQTNRVPVRPDTTITTNLDAARHLIHALGTPTDPTAAKPRWDRVAPEHVIGFVQQTNHLWNRSFDRDQLIDYIERENAQGRLIAWTVLLSCTSDEHPRGHDANDPRWTADLGVPGRPRIGLVSRTRLKTDPTSLGAVTDPTDEPVALDQTQRDAADRAHADGTFESLSEARRAQLDPTTGVLILYPISPASAPRTGTRNRKALFEQPIPDTPVMAYAMQLPPNHAHTVEYVSAPPPRTAR